jgi:pyruvate carboxylase subunit B
MPGKVLGVHVETGQKVVEGDLILSLEAMKMQSEIFCGRAGMVKKILVREGDAVNAGDAMVIIG